MTREDLVGAVVKNIFISSGLVTLCLVLPTGEDTVLIIDGGPAASLQARTQTGCVMEGLAHSPLYTAAAAVEQEGRS